MTILYDIPNCAENLLQAAFRSACLTIQSTKCTAEIRRRDLVRTQDDQRYPYLLKIRLPSARSLHISLGLSLSL